MINNDSFSKFDISFSLKNKCDLKISSFYSFPNNPVIFNYSDKIVAKNSLISSSSTFISYDR